jgi:hypothetical protein
MWSLLRRGTRSHLRTSFERGSDIRHNDTQLKNDLPLCRALHLNYVLSAATPSVVALFRKASHGLTL